MLEDDAASGNPYRCVVQGVITVRKSDIPGSWDREE